MGSHRVGHDWSDLAAAAAADHYSEFFLTLHWNMFDSSKDTLECLIGSHFPCGKVLWENDSSSWIMFQMRATILVKSCLPGCSDWSAVTDLQWLISQWPWALAEFEPKFSQLWPHWFMENHLIQDRAISGFLQDISNSSWEEAFPFLPNNVLKMRGQQGRRPWFPPMEKHF